MTDDLNKQWAELEGWWWDKLLKMWHLPHPKDRPLVGEIYGKELPDWTEPNRFFAEVVPRMADLLSLEQYWDWIYHFAMPLKETHKELSGISMANVFKISLTVAIQTRKELGK